MPLSRQKFSWTFTRPEFKQRALFREKINNLITVTVTSTAALLELRPINHNNIQLLRNYFKTASKRAIELLPSAIRRKVSTSNYCTYVGKINFIFCPVRLQLIVESRRIQGFFDCLVKIHHPEQNLQRCRDNRRTTRCTS